MSDFVLVAGDKAVFMPMFGAAVVVVQPGTLQGSGPATLDGKKVCVDGDEKRVRVAGCAYLTSQHPISGTGTLTIDALAGDQKATKATTGGKALLLRGGSFTAKFQVQSPAQRPTPAGPEPDASPQYSGTGTFLTTNTKFQAT